MSLLRRIFSFRENPEETKPFLEHLEDLRWTLMKMVAALVAGMILSFNYRNELMRIVQKPLHDIDPELVQNLQVLGIMDPLMISIKLAFYAGIVLTFPVLLYFMAQFVVPALTTREKRLVSPVIVIGCLLFAAGVSFGYFYILPETLEFFFGFSKDMQLIQRPTATSYFSFVTQTSIALGLAFELPMVVMALNYLGILSYEFMTRTRIFAIPILFALAAIIAPTPDPFTLFAVAIPMCALYEACIWIAWFMDRTRRRKQQALEEGGGSVG